MDWSVAAKPDVVEVLTTNEDGSTRETKVWIVAVDEQGYLRTGGTRWYANIEREPNVVLRSGGVDYPLRAELIEDEELSERIAAALREKHGFSDRMAGLIRFGPRRILRLVPRRTDP